MSKTAADMARIAREVVAGRKRGLEKVTINGVEFNTLEKGWCSKFVRQVHEATTGRAAPWPGWFAVWTERNLHRGGYRVVNPQVGDIVCFNAAEYARLGRERVWNAKDPQNIRDWGAQGHIGILVGDGLVAENTSSAKRGDPRAAGTKLTPLDQIGASRISGYYAVLPTVSEAPAEEGVKVVYQTEQDGLLVSSVLTAEGRIIGDRLWVPLRDVGEGLGHVVDARKLKGDGLVIIR